MFLKKKKKKDIKAGTGKHFSAKDQTMSILGFTSHVVPVVATELSCCGVEAPIDARNI